MEFVLVAVAVFSLLSVGQSTPVTSCESLIQPLEIQGRDQLLGRWAVIAEATDVPKSRAITMLLMDNAWVNITAANKSDTINTLQISKMLSLCFSLSSDLTLGNGTLTVATPFRGSAVLLSSGCPDCMVFKSKYTIGGSTISALQLYSRRSQVSEAELKEFQKQAECVNLPEPAVLNPEKGFCPDPSLSQGTHTTDLSNVVKYGSLSDLSILEEVLRSPGGLQTLVKLFSGNIEKLVS